MFALQSLCSFDHICMLIFSQRWERENAELPRHLRRKAPVRPEAGTGDEDWNRLAWQASQVYKWKYLKYRSVLSEGSLRLDQYISTPGKVTLDQPYTPPHILILSISIHNNKIQLTTSCWQLLLFPFIQPYILKRRYFLQFANF